MQCDALLKNLTVLFVEDEESLLQLLVSALGRRFRQYEVARNGEEGLQKVSASKPDIIISDITMPVMDGLSMADAIHQEYPELPIIILSAYSDREKLLHAIDAGITKYFIKPFDPDELLSYLCTLAQKIDHAQQVKLMEPYHFDIKEKQLLKHNRIVKLTPRELDLIAFLVETPNHIVSNQQIKAVIGREKEVSDESVRVFIRRLREKTDKALIQNLPKQGYMLQTQ